MKKAVGMILPILLLAAVVPAVFANAGMAGVQSAPYLQSQSIRYEENSVDREDADRLAAYQEVVDRVNRELCSHYSITGAIQEEILSGSRGMNLQTFEAWLRNNHATGSFIPLGNADPQSEFQGDGKQSSGAVLIPNVNGPLYVSQLD